MIKVVLKIVLVSQICFIAHGSTNKFNKRVCETHIKPGDFMIGGLFDLYETDTARCDGWLTSFAVSFVESITYSIDLINQRYDILPNISLGYTVYLCCI